MRRLNNLDDVQEGMFMVCTGGKEWIGYVGPGKKRFCIRLMSGTWQDHKPISDHYDFDGLFELEEDDPDYLPALLHISRCALGAVP